MPVLSQSAAWQCVISKWLPSRAWLPSNQPAPCLPGPAHPRPPPASPNPRRPLACRLQVETLAQKALVGVAVTYMLLIVIIPFVNVFVQAFSHGLGPFVETLQEPDFQQASKQAEAAEQSGIADAADRGGAASCLEWRQQEAGLCQLPPLPGCMCNVCVLSLV